MSSKVHLKASSQKSNKFDPVGLGSRRGSDISVMKSDLLRGTEAASPVQAKLTISQPHDPLEQEADRMADSVMTPDGSEAQQRASEGEGRENPGGQNVMRQEGESEAEDEEDETVQAKSISRKPVKASPKVEKEIKTLHGSGQPLSRSSRSFFEPRFGHDFSQVRVHTDSRASSLSRSVQAKAFTVGKHIAFAPGQYQPNSSEGQKLMAHELTHVVQQGASKASSGKGKRRK